MSQVYLVRIIVHNCHTQYSTEQFWLFSLLTSRQPSSLRCCLMEGRGQTDTAQGHNTYDASIASRGKKISVAWNDVFGRIFHYHIRETGDSLLCSTW